MPDIKPDTKPHRIITEHQVNPCNDALQVHVLDEPGAGGASHHYAIVKVIEGQPDEMLCEIKFQNGPIGNGDNPGAGVNGVTQEALLAIVSDRLQSFQNGHYRCRENAKALNKVQEAVHWLLHRTRARMARGVEGTSKK